MLASESAWLTSAKGVNRGRLRKANVQACENNAGKRRNRVCSFVLLDIASEDVGLWKHVHSLSGHSDSR